MRKYYAVTTPEELRNLCIRNNWFTSGTSTQYEKLFQLNEDGQTTLSEIALIIWVCSDDTDRDEITSQLIEAKDDYVQSWRLEY